MSKIIDNGSPLSWLATPGGTNRFFAVGGTLEPGVGLPLSTPSYTLVVNDASHAHSSGSVTVSFEAEDTAALIDFATPTNNLEAGTDLQRFRVLVRKTGVANPTVALKLYESGSLVATLVSGVSVTSSVGQIVIAYWDSSLLSSLAGAGVQLRVEGTHNADSTIEIGAVVWEANETTGVTLVVGAASHAHTTDNLTLTQANTLVVASASHAHTTDNLTLTQANTLVVASAEHGHTADNLTLTQANTLVVASASHAHTTDNLALTQANTLVVASASHAHTVDAVTLDAGISLVIGDCFHATAADNLALQLVKIVEFLAASGQTLTAKLFAVGSAVVQEEALFVSASPNRQMIYGAGFYATGSGVYQLVAYASGVPVASWYVKLSAAPGVHRSGNYADVVMAESLELMRKVIQNKTVTNPVTGRLEIYDDADAAIVLSADMFEAASGDQKYRGRGAEVRERLS